MKPRTILALIPVLLALFMFSPSQKAAAVEIGVSVGGGQRYYRGGTVIEYRTTDPVYSTWYPDNVTTYVYDSPSYSSSYYGNGYGNGYGYYSTPYYVYSTQSSGYNGWYGGGRSGNGGYYGVRGGYGYYGGGRGGDRGHRR